VSEAVNVSFMHFYVLLIRWANNETFILGKSQDSFGNCYLLCQLDVVSRVMFFIKATNRSETAAPDVLLGCNFFVEHDEITITMYIFLSIIFYDQDTC